MTKSKLIIHETDCHGSGTVYFEGRTENYSYDDGSLGDVRRTVEGLIDLGFIDPNDVIIFDDYDNNIYKFVEKVLTNQTKYDIIIIQKTKGSKKMKVTVYVNWDEREVISEKEYKEMIEKSAKEYAESYADFADWLNDNYHADDIWELSENGRNVVKEEYREACHTWAEDEVNDYWKPYEIEV